MIRRKWNLEIGLSQVIVVLVCVGCVGDPPGLPEADEMGGTMGNETVSGETSSERASGEWASSEDETSIPVAECGNGRIEGEEQCDTGDIQDMTCENFGYSSGVVTCMDDCTFDLSACAASEMVLIPAGTFEMGSGERPDEQPVRQVYLDAFYIDPTEVTLDEYSVCVDAGACDEPEDGGDCNYQKSDRGDHPVNCVEWYDAESYCNWVEGGTKRLLTEAEWEKAARGTDMRRYPWGDAPEPTCTHVVMDEGGNGCGRDVTWQVGSKPMGASPYGVQNMAGSVAEWISDWYDVYDAEQVNNPTGPEAAAEDSRKVRRGSSWRLDDPDGFRAANRSSSLPSDRFSDVGIRCAKTPSSSQ